MEHITELQKSCLDFNDKPKAFGVTWKDSTSYSQGNKLQIPTCFSTKIGDCKLSIIYGHVIYKNMWIMNCYELNMKEVILKAKTAKQAAEEAIITCNNKVNKIFDDFKSARVINNPKN